MKRYIVSIRDKFYDSNDIVEGEPRVRTTPYGPEIAWDDFCERLKGQRVCWNIHGYRSNGDGVIDAGDAITSHLSNYYQFDSVVTFLWPGSWSKTVGYLTANNRAKACGAKLSSLLYQSVGECEYFDLQMHSLGNLVGLEAMRRIDEARVHVAQVNGVLDMRVRGSLPLRNFVMTAAAVPRDFLSKPEFAGPFVFNCEKVKVFYSSNDTVLKYGFRFASWFTPALGNSGPQKNSPISRAQLVPHDLSHSVKSHGGYRSEPEFYDRWLLP